MTLPIVRETGFRITAEAAREQLPTPEGQQWITMLHRGELEVELYAPSGTDLQTPHTRDELYFILRGTGDFALSGRRHPFAPGEAYFVAAGVDHRFENFSDDFLTWVVFYGPEGGDAAGDGADGTKIAENGVAVLE